MLYNQNWERPLNSVSEALLKAADLLEIHGHVKGTRKNDSGSMCLLGAIEEAQDQKRRTLEADSPITYRAAEAIAKVLRLKPSWDRTDYRGAAAAWNNKPERTAQEVIDVMRQAARVAQPVD